MAHVSADRAEHWISRNHQNRIPRRWVAFDSESRSVRTGDIETQTFGIATAFRWRSDLKTGDRLEYGAFETPQDLWEWVTDYCRPKTRTCVAAHNLGHDIRITQVFTILPKLGWQLEWCNLDRNVSAMTWRGDKGTLILWDTWTWLPVPLHSIGADIGTVKLAMPGEKSSDAAWEKYCKRDAEIVYLAVRDLVNTVRAHDLGNWQPTGAGMSYATWRHKFMTDNVLVHANIGALDAERAAMHTGRAEAWIHGQSWDTVWTEVDLRNAYVTIASDTDLPAKLKFKTGALSNVKFHQLRERYRVLALADITTSSPVVPYYNGERTLWPVGTFRSWLWDTEICAALESGAKVRIRDGYAYTRKPVLQQWALWVLSVVHSGEDLYSPVVRTWVKHCSRALIGRLSLRTARWELFGGNPSGQASITTMVDAETGKVSRQMHIGERTFQQTGITEGRDSLPQITSYIMSECRVRLWRAMGIAGYDSIAHVDTDSLIVSLDALRRLQEAYGDDFARLWAVKGSARRVTVYGPRNYRWGQVRKVAGVSRKAKETAPNEFTGERWQGVSTALENGQPGQVIVETGTWSLNVRDPRRQSGPGITTLPYEV